MNDDVITINGQKYQKIGNQCGCHCSCQIHKIDVSKELKLREDKRYVVKIWYVDEATSQILGAYMLPCIGHWIPHAWTLLGFYRKNFRYNSFDLVYADE